VGRGPDLVTARATAEAAANAIEWAGMQRRHDIALDLPQPAAAAGANA
jgi:phosphoribosylamine-glycine ligase